MASVSNINIIIISPLNFHTILFTYIFKVHFKTWFKQGFELIVPNLATRLLVIPRSRETAPPLYPGQSDTF